MKSSAVIIIIIFIIIIMLVITTSGIVYVVHKNKEDEGYICDVDIANENDEQYMASLIQEATADPNNRAVVTRKYYFNPGDTVYYTFVSPYPELIELAESVLQTYLFPYVNLNYVRVDENDPRVDKRYIFEMNKSDVKRNGTCYGVGTRKSKILVMANLNAEKFQGTLLHESLHSLGFKHEHTNPQNNPIQWYKDKIYEFYEKQGWDKEKVDSQILSRANPKNVITTDYDPYSIMNYKINEDWYYGTTIHRGLELSDGDKQMLVILYGQPGSGKRSSKKQPARKPTTRKKLKRF